MALQLIKNAVCKLNASGVLIRRFNSTISGSNLPKNGVLSNLTLNLMNNQNNWIYKQESPIGLPLNNKIPSTPLSMPNNLWYVPPLTKSDPIINKIIEDPALQNGVEEKQAVRLIVIRKKKMKKHKLRKLRKRMKYEWAKIRQRRELLKEKAFQADLIAQCKRAESFSAEAYVEERLQKLNERVIPKKWKGRRLPEFIIREKLGLPPKTN